MKLFAVALFLALAATAPTQAADSRLTIWDLPLGARATALPPAASFRLLACGSNGGPPGTVLSEWTEFTRCAAEPSGLREVYFEYEDEAELRALAHEDYPATWGLGTTEQFFPVIASALFDDTGHLATLRLVTDPRPTVRQGYDAPVVRPRDEHYLLGDYLAPRFGITPADCHDLAPAPGEHPVLGLFEHRICDKAADSLRYHLEQSYLRKPGQTDLDPESFQPTEGEFESITRFEMTLAP